MKLIDDFLGNGPLQYWRGKHRRSRCGSVVAELIEKPFQVLDRDHPRLQDEGVGSGDAVALEHFVPCFHLLLKGADQRFGSSHGEAHEDQDGQAETLKADVRMETANDAELFEPVDALRNGRGCEADATSQFGPGNPGIVLEFFDDPPGNAIELGWFVRVTVSASGHGS